MENNLPKYVFYRVIEVEVVGKRKTRFPTEDRHIKEAAFDDLEINKNGCIRFSGIVNA
jgi:hypothetical protein